LASHGPWRLCGADVEQLSDGGKGCARDLSAEDEQALAFARDEFGELRLDDRRLFTRATFIHFATKQKIATQYCAARLRAWTTKAGPR
jgi:hypothetical protein